MPTPFPVSLDLIARTFRSKPLLFVAAAWIAGTGLADHYAASPKLACALGLALGLPTALLRRRAPALALLLLGVTCLALSATRLAMLPAPGDISERAGQQLRIQGVIDSEPSRNCDRWRFMLRCESVRFGAATFPTRGRLSVSVPDDMSPRAPGDRVMVFGVPERPSAARNPGGFSAEGWLARQGAFAMLYARPGSVLPLHTTELDWRRWAGRIRHRIAASNRRAMTDPAAAALVNSILFGDLDQDDERLWSATEERFRRAGLSHVLVVSGAQAALLFGLVGAWRRWALRPRRSAGRRHWRLLRATGGYSVRQALGAGLLLLTFYVPLVGLQPSILRPTLVLGIYSAGRWLDRETDPENSLAAAALLLLVPGPLTLYDLGFQLSFAAVWAIVRWTRPLVSCLRPSRQPDAEGRPDDPGAYLLTSGGVDLLMTFQAMTIAAQLGTIPLVAHHFQTLSYIAPISNLPVILMAAVLLPVGLISSILTAAAAAFHPSPWWLIHSFDWPTEQLARLIDAAVSIFARPDWATVSVSPPGWLVVAAIGGLLLLASTPAVLNRRPLCAGLLALAAALFASPLCLPAIPPRLPTLTFIDVGQGDACLVRLPGGATMLVDGGGSPRAPCETRDCSDAPVGHLAESIRTDCTDVGRDILASYLRHVRVRRIDLLVITHPHDDHLWGLDAILDPGQHIQIDAVLDAGMSFKSRANQEWASLLGETATKVILARRGMQLSLGPARLELLHPPDSFIGQVHDDPNKNSIVLRLEVGGSRVLLTGDAEAEAEAAMADEDVRGEVLKVGHHGSAYSTSDAWLARVQPHIAVISCGRHNPFGHPNPDTLERLRRHGVRTYRTDRDGAVTLELHPDGWKATTMLPSQPSS